MVRRTFLPLCAVAALVAACPSHQSTADSGPGADAETPDSGAVDAGTPDAGVDAGTPDAGDAGPPPLTDGGLEPYGGPCSTNLDCESGFCGMVGKFTPGNYCTKQCTTTNPNCPAGTTCGVVLQGEDFCLVNCGAQTDCRPGYACQPTQTSCNLACLVTAECPANTTCNPVNGQCLASCTTASDCLAGQQCNSSGFCTLSFACQSAADCAPTEVCNTTSHLCTRQSTGCTTDGGCPTGETCNVSSGSCGGATGDLCLQDSDCTAGTDPSCLSADAGFPGGLCVSWCSNTVTCPSNEACVAGLTPLTTSVCTPKCTTSADCRAGYQCANGACVPPCTTNAMCGVDGGVCDTTSGTCAGGGGINTPDAGFGSDAG
jgi:hypothetical protein